MPLKLSAVKVFFKESTDFGYIFRAHDRHIQYWLNHSLPVIVAICDPDNLECWWVEVTIENVARTRKSWKITIPYGQRLHEDYKHVLSQIAGRTLSERIRQRYKNRIQLAPIINDGDFVEIIHRGGIVMGFRRITQSDYRALVFSQDYTLYQSDSYYDLDTWRETLELSGVEDWEIEEALEKAEQEIF